uniref:ATP synthase subunit a n=1 Tax=Euretidae gen. sp. DVL-2014 TaxID=1569957 RepID=A0A0N7AL89_9METZ|nr:ATP synthase F0 subunit 6 [Euretidae gen. sp. DVL-2014]
MNASYFDQFNTTKLFYIKISETIIISISNSSLTILLTLIIIISIYKSKKLLPTRSSLIIKILYTISYNLTKEHLSPKHLTFLPLIFSLLTSITVINLIGLLPYVFTTTAHIIITFSLSLTILTTSTLKSILTHKSKFLSILTPQGSPLILTPFLVLIETTSYLTRAISLGIRLAANISAGHLLLIILASFTYNTLLTKYPVTSLFPILILTFISFLEIAVAIIQAYVFTLLSTIYLSDTIKIH